MSDMPWIIATTWSFGALVLICAAIVLWPRKRKPLGHFDARVGRDCYREFAHTRRG